MSKEQSPQKGNGMPRFNLNWLYIVVIGVLGYMLYQGESSGTGQNKQIDYELSAFA